MNLARRRFLHLTVGVVAGPVMSHFARAQSYPSRPVRIIVPTAAGGAADILARLVGQWLSDRLGQSFIVDNRPGGGSNVGTEVVVKAPPDGYTLLLVTTSAAINQTLYNKLNFNFIRDIAPIASISGLPLVMVVNPTVPARDVFEFIAYAKSNPGNLNMGSGGAGSGTHLAGELFKMMAGIDVAHVPYRGVAAALTDLIAGRVHVLFANPASSLEHVRNGMVRALGTSGATRSELLRHLPAISEFIPGYEAIGWFGLGAPVNTPVEIIRSLNKEVNDALDHPHFRSQLAKLDATVLKGSAAEFGEFIAKETERWSRVIKFAGIKSD
jgi:tripartite-type tricarboxylate transporter receptor subunit TctC